MSYTALAVLGVLFAVVLDLVVLRTRVLARRAFWTAYAIILAFQLVTNGWLTGRGIVRYDADAIAGPRVVHAPVEDLLFGFSLVVQTLAWWVWWGRRGALRADRPLRRAAPAAGAPAGTGDEPREP